MNAIDPIQSKYDHVILVLQGGGALGAYQAGVYEGMAEAGYLPDWVTGVSIGAINAALIAGNPPASRVARLRAFWERVSSGLLVTPPPAPPLHRVAAQASAVLSATFGVPGFFLPRVPSPLAMPDGHPAALSVYDPRPLRDTLGELVQFGLINRGKVRLSVGAVNVRSGNSSYFDNARDEIRVEHVMASGALPPAFPPVEIGGEHYWDGGIVSNTPLWYVLDDSPVMNALIVQVDLFSARGELPRDLDQVMERHKDIIYSSKTRFNTTHVSMLQRQRSALHRLLEKLPEPMLKDPDVRALRSVTSDKRIDIVHLINRRYSFSSQSKDFEFSRATTRERWAAGLADMRRTFRHPEWLSASELADGVRTYDLTRQTECATAQSA